MYQSKSIRLRQVFQETIYCHILKFWSTMEIDVFLSPSQNLKSFWQYVRFGQFCAHILELDNTANLKIHNPDFQNEIYTVESRTVPYFLNGLWERTKTTGVFQVFHNVSNMTKQRLSQLHRTTWELEIICTFYLENILSNSIQIEFSGSTSY